MRATRQGGRTGGRCRLSVVMAVQTLAAVSSEVFPRSDHTYKCAAAEACVSWFKKHAPTAYLRAPLRVESN